ncbi:hypothetical protein A2W14_03830 [Candidatus Gottesmanbacteria bacterium RBG_16_37_8]|uniref:Uncharacterized protein n=1 Tax=Candidatus Gottesmanbacteria bacterium RBG_16_37_8 TaxID=1798371 RepID=A0A1F5YU53_9BACT|nr:MAG: hypothetical protein A2W14_03830 [Candidatus Gottesmanbacteria bacterium RBG_16_37_8]
MRVITPVVIIFIILYVVGNVLKMLAIAETSNNEIVRGLAWGGVILIILFLGSFALKIWFDSRS